MPSTDTITTSQGTAFTVFPPTTAIGPLILSITDPRVTIF